MSIARKVNGVWQNIAGSPTIDDDLSATSVNPVQNKVIYEALDDKQDTLIAGTNITIAADGKTISATGAGNNFIGTTAEWNALTDAQKAQYDTYDLTDDYSGAGIDTSPTTGSSNVVTSGGVANHLVVGERKFYFDYQDGQYGYNTSANRGADTFVPFKSGSDVEPGQQTYILDFGTTNLHSGVNSSQSVTLERKAEFTFYAYTDHNSYHASCTVGPYTASSSSGNNPARATFVLDPGTYTIALSQGGAPNGYCSLSRLNGFYIE